MSMKTQLSIASIMLAGLLVSGCGMLGAGVSQTQNVVAPKKAKVAVKNPNTHVHPANKCTNSVTHTHASGSKPHKHRYSCGPKRSANSHRHPANRCTKSIYHSHPNGKKAHKHRYSCQSKRAVNANTHRHPANRYTHSVTHTHPNGARKHNHTYTNHR